MMFKKSTCCEDFPYQHLELNSLPTEKWKWIPGLEGYYKISSFGRVKREGFEMITNDNKRRTVQEKILTGELQKFPNRYVGDQNFHLRVRIAREGIKHEISIARMTYYCFIRKFKLSDMSLVVLALDGDGRNIRPRNLALVNLSQKQKRIYTRKRYKKPVVYSYDEFLKGLKESANPQSRQVTQYTMAGRKIKTYLSIKAAAISLSISESGINAALRERQVSSGGFAWRYGTEKNVDLKTFLEKRAIHRKNLKGTRVTQYDTKGKRIKTFLTISDAAKELGTHNSVIWAALNGRQKSAGGYIWKKGWGKERIAVKPEGFGEALRARAKWKKVKQYDQSGKYIRTFESVNAAAAFVKLSPSSVSSALKRKSNLAGGYKWST